MATGSGSTTHSDPRYEQVVNSVTDNFDTHPYLNQVFNKDVVKCVLDNALQNCDHPPSQEQIDNDIKKATDVYNFILTQAYPNQEELLLLFELIKKFFIQKKCVYGQYPCWSDNLYQRFRDKIYAFNTTNN